MKSPTLLLALAALTYAPDAQGGSVSKPVAEIVTYRLKDGVDAEAHREAARSIVEFLKNTGAVLHRTLSVDETGLWTDHILWSSAIAAKSAETQAMQRPEFGAFFAGMDEASVILRHATVMLQME